MFTGYDSKERRVWGEYNDGPSSFPAKGSWFFVVAGPRLFSWSSFSPYGIISAKRPFSRPTNREVIVVVFVGDG